MGLIPEAPPAPEVSGPTTYTLPKRPPAHWTTEMITPRGEVYTYGGFNVFSQIVKLAAVDKPLLFWMVGIQKWGRSPTDAEVARVLSAFDMADAEEAEGQVDHVRHFSLPILLC